MEGQTIDLQWTAPEPNRLLSVVLYQMNTNTTMAANYNGQFRATIRQSSSSPVCQPGDTGDTDGTSSRR